MNKASLYIKRFCMAVLMITCWGCGTGNSNSPSVNTAGKHPDNWRTAHRKAYLTNPAQCKECHGNDLAGGITKIGCSTTSCHANGHPPRQIAHDMPFLTGTVHGPVAKQDLTFCSDCHGRQTGTTTYRFDVQTSTMPYGCESVGCHNNGLRAVNLGHPKSWLKHTTAGNQANACSLCHGVTFQGDTGPACAKCHVLLSAGVIPVASQNCGSCHGNPPNGGAHPNLIGSHVKHTALPGITCTACHQDAGSGTAFHYYSSSIVRAARLKFAGEYNARSGTATFVKAQGCANIKCHGGITTPIWGTSFSSTAPTNCTTCHVLAVDKQDPQYQYNSPYSGQHRFHVLIQSITCDQCHDIGKLFTSSRPSHFSNLSSISFNLSPPLTLKDVLHYSPTRSCTPTQNGYPIVGCHLQTGSPFPDGTIPGVTKFWGTP